VLAVALAALVLLIGSGFAVFAFARPEGASSPEDAVRQLFDALDQEDAVGVLEALPPSERDVIKQPVLDIVTELKRLGLLSDISVEQVPGADLQVRNLSLSEEPVGSNTDLKAVRVLGGTLVSRTVPNAVPIGPTLRAIIEDDFDGKVEIDDQSDTEDLAKSDLRLITVNEGGGWHVSLFYSVAEAARDGKGSAPVRGGGPAPVGSDTPEGAVRGLIDGAAALDLEKVITMLSPDEAGAVYDYAPLFLPEVREAAEKARSDGFNLEITEVGTSVEGEGDVRKVKLTSFSFKGGEDENHVEGRWDGSCLRGEATFTSPTYDYDYPAYDPDDPNSYEPPARSNRTETDTTSFDSCEAPSDESRSTLGGLSVFGGIETDASIVVVQTEGRWYVSPVRTVFDSMLSSLRRLSPEQLRTWAQEVAKLGDGDFQFEPVSPGTTPGTAYPVPTYPGSSGSGSSGSGSTGSGSSGGSTGGSGGGTSSGTAVPVPGSTVTTAPVPLETAPTTVG
jgi:hypothetical protein